VSIRERVRINLFFLSKKKVVRGNTKTESIVRCPRAEE